jgi:hypothetical protein
MMEKFVFITGFARGGTSWLRDCVGAHPDIAILKRERTIFRDTDDVQVIRDYFEKEAADLKDAKWIVNKAPANAPFVGRAARLFPESKFIFIIRDPRDVYVSHKRGKSEWMRGLNSTVAGCMRKTAIYYQGWLKAQGLPNVKLIRYEDLHQNFSATMKEVLEFIGADSGKEIISQIFQQTNFRFQTGRENTEARSSAKRKGVIGDWVTHLNWYQKLWYRRSKFWQEFMRTHGYTWEEVILERILKAMKTAGVNFLSEDDLLAARMDPNRPNVAVQHDIDLLRWSWCFESVLKTAEIERELGIPACFHFLPLGDFRYTFYRWPLRLGFLSRIFRPRVIELIGRVKAMHPAAAVGLHLNACEKFYPASAPDAGKSPPDLDSIIRYAHQQVAEYRETGIEFRIATAHGYGRAKKLPNNRDIPELSDAMDAENIKLFDTRILHLLTGKAKVHYSITDIGGTIKSARVPGGYSIMDPELYRKLPPGSFLRFLTHPGNYRVDRGATLTMRQEKI